MNYNAETALQYTQNRHNQKAVLLQLLTAGQINAASRVLEVGCGTGNYSAAITSITNCRAWGFDPAAAMAAKARAAGITLHLGRAERYARTGRGMLPPYESCDTLNRLSTDIAATAPAKAL